MSQTSLRRSLISALLVSGAVFSALTLPFLLRSPKSLPDVSNVLSHPLQPVFNREHKETAIRYTGFAIVLSVGAGMTTLEILRQGKSRCRSNQNSASETPSVQVLRQSIQQGIAEVTIPLERNGFAAQVTFSDSTQPSVQSMQPLAASLVLNLHQQCQTCCIRLPGQDRYLLAIEVAHQYYSLCRSNRTWIKTLEIAARLGRSGRKTVITPVDQTYAVWVWQPDAQRV